MGVRSPPPTCVGPTAFLFAAAAASIAFSVVLSRGSTDGGASQQLGAAPALGVIEVPPARAREFGLISGGVGGGTKASACRVEAPLQCGFLYSAQETILYPEGVLELSSFSDICQENCLLYLQESAECQSEPILQQLMLSICQGFQCAQDLTQTCGDITAGKLLDHSLACTQECEGALDSSTCDGAGEFLPGFVTYQSLIGASKPECVNFQCQQQLAPVCPTFSASTKSMLSSDMCLEECHEVMMGAQCLSADISVVDISGQYLMPWNNMTGLDPSWGPSSDGCAAPSDSGFTVEMNVVFPEISHEDLVNDLEAKAAFEKSIHDTLSEALDAMGIEPGSATVEIVETKVATGSTSQLTIASETNGTEVTALLTFASEADRDFFVEVVGSDINHISDAFANAGLQAELKDMQVPDRDVSVAALPSGADEGDTDSQQPPAAPFQPPATSVASGPVTVDVLDADKGLEDDPSGFPMGAVIGIIVAFLAALAIIAAIVVLKRRRKDESSDDEGEQSQSSSTGLQGTTRTASSPARGVVFTEHEGEHSTGTSPAVTNRSVTDHGSPPTTSRSVASPLPAAVDEDEVLDSRVVADLHEADAPWERAATPVDEAMMSSMPSYGGEEPFTPV